MNSLAQIDTVSLLSSLSSGLSKCLVRNLGKSSLFSLVGLLGLLVGAGLVLEPMMSGDRTSVFAETCVKPSVLQNFLNKYTLGEESTDRYAAAVNAIENKRLEIFRIAKSHPNWNNVANMAEFQKTKVCDIANPPEFLRSLCNQLRSYSEEQICRYGFTTKEFNQITLEQMSNPQLRRTIQDKQVQLRNNKK